ncbi:MAG: VWA domain-containing protein [Spirochaetes bacterium]|nr:VWA domain-containing protein [Spirochaetota bacterium]
MLIKIKFTILSITIILFTNMFAGKIFADGFIVVPEPPRNIIRTAFPLEVKYHRVNADLNDQGAVTYIDQEFYNPTGARLEGFYIFPVPENAVIKKFTMFINGTETEAELLDAKKASRIYEDIVRKSLDPALLEYQGRGIFKVRIFPIEPGSTKRVKISYTQILEKDNGTMEYTYPLNTEKFSAKPLNNVSINVNLKSSDSLKNIYCTSHETDIVRKNDNHAVVSWEQKNIKPDTDFNLYYNTDKSGIGLSVLAYKEKGNDGYFFLSASPGIDSQDSAISEKDITFVLDVSGSMAGEKLEQAKKALLFCVNNLNRGDRFQLIRFSTEAEALFNELVKADKANMQKAKNFISDMKAVGGTHIEEAVSLALSVKDGGRPHMIIFITDGRPTIGETDEDKLVKKIRNANKSNIRIFTFGIGYDINTHLLDKITKETRAYRYYISPKEDIEVKISNFYTKVQSPVLTDIKLTFTGNIRASKTYPRDLPDIFAGSSVTILGSYSGSGDVKVILEGRLRDKVQKYEYKINYPAENTGNDFVPYLWAARHIGYLLDQIRLNGGDKELVEEATEAARKYGIVTPYTSYLILEDERKRVSGGGIREEDQTLGSVAPRVKDFAKKSEMEYRAMGQKSGAESVLPSREFQALNNAANVGDALQGSSRLGLSPTPGNAHSGAGQVKTVQGRAVYNAGGYWIDSRIQTKKRSRTVRIRFAGKEYFDLLSKKPESAQFCSLGKNIRFMLDDVVYEVYE